MNTANTLVPWCDSAARDAAATSDNRPRNQACDTMCNAWGKIISAAASSGGPLKNEEWSIYELDVFAPLLIGARRAGMFVREYAAFDGPRTQPMIIRHTLGNDPVVVAQRTTEVLKSKRIIAQLAAMPPAEFNGQHAPEVAAVLLKCQAEIQKLRGAQIERERGAAEQGAPAETLLAALGELQQLAIRRALPLRNAVAKAEDLVDQVGIPAFTRLPLRMAAARFVEGKGSAESVERLLADHLAAALKADVLHQTEDL